MTNARQKTLLSWSSGKDSAWALYRLQQMPEIDLAGLFTTVNARYRRVAMHAVRIELLQRQADAAGLPLSVIEIPDPCDNAAYDAVMRDFISRAKGDGVTHMAFGDLYLEDIRDYRISRLEGTGITPLFPLWGMPTRELAREMIGSGLKAHLTCVDPQKLDAAFAGRSFDAELLAALPESVDPCGENGEFHTFAHAGPMFRHAVDIVPGETVMRDGFVFSDLLPGRAGSL